MPEADIVPVIRISKTVIRAPRQDWQLVLPSAAEAAIEGQLPKTSVSTHLEPD